MYEVELVENDGRVYLPVGLTGKDDIVLYSFWVTVFSKCVD